MLVKFRQLFLLIFFLPAWMSAAELEPGTISQQHLFKIERSKNANIVQYDVQVRADGTLDSKTPVVAYWIRLNEDGRRMKLRFFEKRFAYGFSAAYEPASNSVTLVMKADLGRDLKVLKTTDGYRAMVIIDGRDALIDKIFVQSSGKKLLKQVEYIELHGVDRITGEDRFEKYIP